ncbi:hypothetical protein LEMLEM_LOCUS7559, partial [Lemmus lemmus]
DTWACWAPLSAFDDWLPKGTCTLTGRDDLFIALIRPLCELTNCLNPTSPQEEDAYKHGVLLRFQRRANTSTCHQGPFARSVVFCPHRPTSLYFP